VTRRLSAVHLRRTGGRRLRDLVNSGVHRLRAQVLGALSHEATKRRGAYEPSILRGQVLEIERPRELGSSQGENPNIGYSKSQSCEE
jgi:hypothetical protein